jgi:hypothetical protein
MKYGLRAHTNYNCWNSSWSKSKTSLQLGTMILTFKKMKNIDPLMGAKLNSKTRLQNMFS